MATARSSWSRLTIALLALTIVSIALPAPATVSGQNGKIAFVTDRDGNAEIYLMDSDGSDLVNLTQNPARDSSPAWSPDGRQIAFASDRSGESAIYIMDANGSDVRLLTSGEDPAWSPDGHAIALTRNGSVYVLRLTGGEIRVTDPATDNHPRLPISTPPTTVTIVDRSPAWSPDGARLAFVRHYQGGTPTAAFAQLFTTDATALQLPEMMPSTSWTLNPPDWSPDGRRIVIGEVSTHGLEVQTVLVAADGSEVVRLPIPSGFDRSAFPAWSPDGRRIISVMGRLNTIPLDFYTTSPDGSDLVNLTDDSAFGFDPAWQPLNPYPVGLVDPSTGIWYLRDRDAAVTSFYYGSPGDYPFLGDWDGDGIETPGLYRQSDGYVYLRNSNTQGIADIRFFFGNPGDIPLAGDFDGDGVDTISIYRPSETRVYVINELGSKDGGLGQAEYSYLFGDPGDKPFVGDFDGDGIDTVGLHRESTGKVYYRDSNTQGIADNTFVYGDPGDRLFAHDWNGDGMDSPAVFRPVNSTLYFRFSNDDGVANVRYIWGGANWLPVAGDFDTS